MALLSCTCLHDASELSQHHCSHLRWDGASRRSILTHFQVTVPGLVRTVPVSRSPSARHGHSSRSPHPLIGLVV